MMKMQRTNESQPEPDAEEKALRGYCVKPAIINFSLNPFTGLRLTSMKPG